MIEFRYIPEDKWCESRYHLYRHGSYVCMDLWRSSSAEWTCRPVDDGFEFTSSELREIANKLDELNEEAS